jgi:hypothetical protein
MDSLKKLNHETLPFAQLLGIRLISAAPDRVVAEMLVRDDLCTRPAVYARRRDDGLRRHPRRLCDRDQLV